ncbi:MAG: hypothetical protein GF411_18440 [Candidatus Lokiarchaeota archaeon]|nr:hypothetical protein [Candidatus Lokiarchaeota archaeon]
MKREIEGTIVSSQIEHYGDNDIPTGIVTIRAPDKEYYKFEININTECETVKEDAKVHVIYEPILDSKTLRALKIEKAD